jgi:class 3 adenylate cyclase
MPDASGEVTSPNLHDEESAVRATGLRELKEVIEDEGKEGPFLLYNDDSGAQRFFRLEGDRAVTIGRDSEVDVSLPWDGSVSSVHAEAVRLGAHWLISDEGISRNGTFVNHERVRGRRRLRHGDVIRVGGTLLTFNEVSAGRRGTTTIADAMTVVGTATVLFTDLVGSTEILARLGDEAGDRVLRDHFEILREAARAHGGREVKNLGDGLMLVFPSARRAVACAASMQQRLVAHNDKSDGEAMGLRIGLNAGEVIKAEDDYFGMPVVVAKRLCDRAAPGQTLSSEIVRALVGSPRDYRFIALGTLSLKGIADPVSVFELDWTMRDTHRR